MKHYLPGIRNLIISISATALVLVTMPNDMHAEGTKQVRPDSTVSGGSLMIDRNNPMYTRFGYIGCPANYRLYIHIKNVGETILFGLQPPVANVGYNLRRPNGTIAMTGTLPMAGAGYIRYYQNAIIGPFPAFGGYTPLSQKITSIADTGDWYFEVRTIPNGATCEFSLFDFQVVNGLNSPAFPADTINGRLWSQSWQFYANLGGNNTFEPFNAGFYVYSDDGITTTITFRGVHWGEGTIFCNPVGCYNTGNFPVDRQSSNNNTYATFPGIAWYKVFLNNPDTSVYRDGEYGRVTQDPTMIDDPNYPVCSGKKYIEVVVNKKGRVIVHIDVPYGDSTYDVIIEADVNPGLNHIPWNGLDNHGGQVPAGTWLELDVTFINGLTNLPLWDIEQNPLGYKVDLIRPTGPTLSEPLIYWDDSQLQNDGNCPNAPNTVNLGGCDPTTSVCHDWAGIDCHEKMINSWWYSGSTSTVPLWVYYSKTPDVPVPFSETRCGPGTDTLHVTTSPAIFTADWYDSPNGGNLLLAGSKTFITPSLNGTTTFYALTRDTVSGCISARVPVTVTVLPLPVMPAILSSNPSVFCFNQPGNFTLNAAGGSGSTLRWFTGSCGATDIGTGTPLTLPVPAVTTTYYARWENVCGPSACNNVTVNIQSNVLSGLIIPDQTICTGGDPAMITSAVPGSGSGIISYRWERFSGAGPWTVINGVTGDTYDPPAGLMVTTSYRRIAISTLGGVACESLPTPVVTVTVNTVTAGTVGSNQQICSSGDPALLTELSGATGAGLITYQWQSSTTGCAGQWSDIPGAVNITFDPPPGLIQTTYFHRVASSTLNGVACSAVSGCITVTVLPTPDVTAAPPSQVLCSGGITGIALSGTIPTTTFTWTTIITPAGSIAGSSNGVGADIIQTLVNLTPNPATVTYTVTPTANGCTGAPVNVVVTVNPRPTVVATPPVQSICSMEMTNIALTSATPNSTFTWTATVNPAGSINGALNGSGYNITQPLINNTNSPSTVTYTITATASGCQGVPSNATVTVNPLPVPTINGPVAVCISPNGYNYSTEAGMSNYIWTVSGGTVTSGSGTNAITVVWNAPGLHSVEVSYMDGNGCTPVIPSFLPINIISLVASIVGTNVPCFGDNNGTAFVNVSGGSGGYTYLWDDPLAQTTNPAINLAPGTYTVLVTDGNLCSISKSITIIQEHPTPSASLSVSGGDKICQGNSVFLKVDMTGTPPWSLTYTDGTTSTTVTGIMSSPFILQVFPATSCIYTITALTDAFCTAVPGMLQGSGAVTVYPLPAVEYTWNTTLNNYEIRFHIDSTITNLGAIGYMCLWNFGDGTFGYGHNPLHLYPGSTTFNCTLTVTDTNGCSNSVTHNIFVPPVQIAFYSSDAPTCLGKPMCFQDLSTVPNPPATYIKTWVWNFDDGTPPDTIHFPNNPDVCHTYAAIGTYMVNLTIRDNWGTSYTYAHDQHVIPLPISAFTWSSNCAGQPVQFSDASEPNGGDTIKSWQWDFGDPTSGIYNTSALQNPEHIFSSGSTSYNVTLIIQNFNGCSDTVTQAVYILSKPVVEFSHDSSCMDEIVHFTADASIMQIDSIVGWIWDFGDGSSPSLNPESATHTYTAPGIYITVLTVTDHHGCFNSISHGVKVNPLPVPVFSWSTPACAGNPVEFTDQSTLPPGYNGYIAKWLWDFGDGTSQLVVLPGSPNVTHTFVGTSMTHMVRLTEWTNDSCSQFVEYLIETLPSPVADFSSASVLCKDQPVQFTDQTNTNGGGAISVWNWNFGDPASGIDNISNLQNPLHTYLASGTYPVRLIISNLSGCTDSIIKAVTINIAPVPDFHADTVCLHTLTQFTDNSSSNGGTILSYTWDFGDGSAVSHMQDPTHAYLIAGQFNVTLSIVNSNGCIKDTVKPVYVNPLPVPAFSFSAPNCLGSAMNFTDLSTTPPGYLGSIVRWVWDFGDGTTSTILAPDNPNVSHTFAGTALSHIVRLTVTTSDACANFTEHTVNSIPAPLADFGFPALNCTSLAVQFADQALTNGGGPIITWQWDFGDPVSGMGNHSTNQNPVHLFSGPGTYSVVQIISNVSGCLDTLNKTITIDPSPLADFISDTACMSQATQFTDQSLPNASGIISYLWDFGDGTATSSLKDPSHTYSSYGIKNVKLSITNSNGCIHDTIKHVLVRPLPIAAFTFSSQNCNGSAIQFTDGSTTLVGYPSNIVQWEWNFGDGTAPVIIQFPGNPDVSHTFTGTANAYIIRLTVTTSYGCSDFTEHTVYTMPSPVANFSNPPNNCPQQPVQFNDLSLVNGGGNITQWHWNFGDPSSGMANNSIFKDPLHTFINPGTYTITEVVISSSGCSDTALHTIIVLPPPVADFTADTACLGSATHFVNQSSSTAGAITQQLWEFGDGTSSSAQDPVHIYQADGLYLVRLSVTTQDGCTNEIIKQVKVVPIPVAVFSASGPTCLGDSVDFTDNSYAMYGTIHMWEWDFGDGTATAIIDPYSPDVNHLYMTSGTFNVVLRITTYNGCSATSSKLVEVQPAPIADYAYSSDRCEMKPVQFTDLSQPNGGAAVTQWSWDFNDPGSGSSNFSTLKNPVHTFSGSGTYNVTLQITSGTECVNSVTKPVTVNAEPTAAFSSDPACAAFATHFSDQSVPNAPSISAWYWNFGDPGSGTGNTSNQQNPSHIYSNSGNYFVTLRVVNSNSCENDTLMMVSIPSSPVALFSYTATCVNTATQFTDLSNAPNSQLSAWYWDFGDGIGTSNLQNPVYTYTVAGTYNVKLRVTNVSGCSDSITIPVLSRPRPQANYNYTNFFCPAGQVNFQDQSNGNGAAISDRLWIFEPGSTSDLHDPTYVFPVTDTNYLVTLIVTNDFGCKDTIIQSVYVKPAFSFTFTNDIGCTNHPTQFHAQNNNPADSLYFTEWNFGDPASGNNNTSTLHDPTHLFTSPGSHIVKLTARNSDNCVDSVYRTVIVPSLPVPSYSFVSPPCDSLTLFTDQSTSGSGTIVSWSWNFGDGSPVQNLYPPASGNTSHVFDHPGTYMVSLVVTNNFGCSETLSHPVERPACLVSSFIQSDPGACSNAPVRFTDSSTPADQINQWHWDFGDGSDTVYHSYTGTLQHSYSSAGTYLVVLSISAGINGQSFMDTAMREVTIDPSPQAAFSASSSCLHQVNNFYDQSGTFGSEIASWKWNFGDPPSGLNNSSNLPDPSHRYKSAGKYNVSLTLINKAGCRDSLSKMTHVYALPDARFESDPACSKNPTHFTDHSISNDTTIYSWLWKFGVPQSKNDTSTQADPVYEYKKEGHYDVKLVVEDSHGCYDTVDSIIKVNPSPLSAFILVENVKNTAGKIELKNKSEEADSYFWDFGNGLTSTDENPFVTYKEDGTYTIMLVSSNTFGCRDTSYYSYELLFKGLYVPNAFAPTMDIAGVNQFKPVGVNLKNYKIEVFDSWGHKLWESSALDADGRPVEGWNGRKPSGDLYQQGTYVWKINATFTDGSVWEGSDIGKGEFKAFGTVTLIR